MLNDVFWTYCGIRGMSLLLGGFTSELLIFVKPSPFELSPLSSVFSVQLFFLGEIAVILPLLPLSLFSWLSDLLSRIYCSAYTFFFDIKSLKDSTFFISRGG